jgi:hypothetical protein
MNEKLGRFVEQVMSLGPGGRWPNSGNDITQHLQQSTAQFAQALQEPQNYSVTQVQALAEKIEGFLLAEDTINSWGQTATDNLIDALHDLTPKT